MRTAGLAILTWALIYCVGGLSACSEAHFELASDNEEVSTDDVQSSDACENDDERRSCSCTDGSPGVQDCLAGSWSECDCDDPLDVQCTPGEDLACICADGSDGVRSCANGVLTDCVCEDMVTACTVCHAYPPAPPHPASTDCSSCHSALNEDDVTFADHSTHMNGSFDVSCTACHGDPPSTGAHPKHVTELTLACGVCHGHDGTGATHAEGGATPVRANVDLVFDSAVSHPSGTTMDNGLTASATKDTETTCQVGCHNPVVGDVPHLDNSVVWTAGPIPCSACHERPGLAPPENHPMGTTVDEIQAGCTTCHDVTDHTSGNLAFHDPDPSDNYEYSQGIDDLCMTCHDGGTGTYFGGTPTNMNSFRYKTHYANGYRCTTCHSYHQGEMSGNLSAPTSRAFCSTCHVENHTLSQLCVDCHDPHRS